MTNSSADEKTAIRFNKRLTELATKVFGDIVARAFITTWDLGSTDTDIEKRLQEADCYNSESDEINFDDKVIWIEFINGKIVDFYSAEWGAIKQADLSTSYVKE